MNAKQTSEIKDNKSKIKKSVTERELISVAKGMVKDGFSIEDIAKETGLSIQLVKSIQRK